MKNKSLLIFIALFLLTSLTFFSSYSSISTIALLIITFIKGFLIANYFMELKDVKLKYSMIILLWLFFVLSLIAFAFIF